MGKVSDAISLLSAKSSSMTGDELEALLVSLNFDVKLGNSGNHHVVTHDGLADFYSTSFDKGHGKHMLPCYPRSIKRVLKTYQDQLESILGEVSGKT